MLNSRYISKWKVIVSSANAGGQKRSNQIAIVDNHSAFGRSRVALKTFATEQEAKNFFKYATSEIIRFAFLLTDESLTSLAKKVPDLLDYTDANGIIDYVIHKVLINANADQPSPRYLSMIMHLIVPHCSQIPKVARILYNPTDYTKIRATNSSLSYNPFTISTKFAITYSASSIDILVFRGSVISFSNR